MIAQESSFFFFNDPATAEIYTLSLHDALPICPDALDALLRRSGGPLAPLLGASQPWTPSTGDNALDVLERLLPGAARVYVDRKSTRLNSSHANISYAVFCLIKTHTSPLYRLML